MKPFRYKILGGCCSPFIPFISVQFKSQTVTIGIGSLTLAMTDFSDDPGYRSRVRLGIITGEEEHLHGNDSKRKDLTGAMEPVSFFLRL